MPKIIGITGNIASGKSVVSQYLQDLGVLTIDADVLAQRAMAMDSPLYKKIVKAFGSGILDRHSEIDRKSLAKIVFSDPKKLAQLESLSHPYVSAAIGHILDQTKFPVVAIEAIKLFEAGLSTLCDETWVVAASEDIRMQRLIDERGMDRQTALLRLQSQSPQQEKFILADIVINTEGSYQDTYSQAKDACQRLMSDDLMTGLSCSLTKNFKAHLLSPSNIPTIEAFFEEIDNEQPSTEQLFRYLGKHAIIGIFDYHELISLVFVKFKLGYACAFQQVYNNRRFSHLPRFWTNLYDHLPSLGQKFFIEVFVIEESLFRPDNSQMLPTYQGKISDLTYAYKSDLSKITTWEQNYWITRCISAEDFYHLFCLDNK